jgi:hypothetical protein
MMIAMALSTMRISSVFVRRIADAYHLTDDCAEPIFTRDSRIAMVGIAQLVRALVCGIGGRGFKSRYPPFAVLGERIASHRENERK